MNINKIHARRIHLCDSIDCSSVTRRANHNHRYQTFQSKKKNGFSRFWLDWNESWISSIQIILIDEVHFGFAWSQFNLYLCMFLWYFSFFNPYWVLFFSMAIHSCAPHVSSAATKNQSTSEFTVVWSLRWNFIFCKEKVDQRNEGWKWCIGELLNA